MQNNFLQWILYFFAALGVYYIIYSVVSFYFRRKKRIERTNDRLKSMKSDVDYCKSQYYEISRQQRDLKDLVLKLRDQVEQLASIVTPVDDGH